MVVINIPSVWLCVTTMEQKIVPHVKKWVIFRKQNNWHFDEFDGFIFKILLYNIREY